MQAIGVCAGIWSAQRLALIKWARSQRRILDSAFIEQFRRVSEGAEHVVYHDQELGLAIKATHPNRYGHSARNEGLQATPLEYLQRLGWHNAFFGDDIKIVGITFFEETIEVVSTQPWIVADVTNPATPEEIDCYFAALRFRRVEVTPGVPLKMER